MKKRTSKSAKIMQIAKLGMFILALGLYIFLTVILFPYFKSIITENGQAQFANYFGESKANIAIGIVALQILQIFLMFLPGEPVEFIAGLLLGSVWGTIVIMLSAGVISIIVYNLVRKYGKKFVLSFMSEKNVQKFEKSKLFKNPKKLEWIMLILFLLPGTPKDALVYIGGLLPLNPVKFMLIISLGRFPSVISSTLAGDYVMKEKYFFMAIVYFVTFVISVISTVIINKIEKNKNTINKE